MPFTAEKQTALLMFLNNGLPPASSGLSAMRITNVTQNAAAQVATVTLVSLVGSNVASFEKQLATTAGDSLNTQMAAAGLSTGYSAKLLSSTTAPQMSIASQIQALGVPLANGNGAEAAAPSASGGGGGSSTGIIVGVVVAVVVAVAVIGLLAGELQNLASSRPALRIVCSKA